MNQDEMFRQWELGSISNSSGEPADKKHKLVKTKNAVHKRKRKLITKDMVTLKDLKIFADSLIHELKIAQESMFSCMREELRKLMTSRSNFKKNVRCSNKNKVGPVNGIDQVVSSSYLTLPTVISKPQFNNNYRNQFSLNDNTGSEMDILNFTDDKRFCHPYAEFGLFGSYQD